MKMVKKVLFGAVALAAILTLASCGKKNDTNKAIKGSGDNWTVDYTNDADSNYRAYRSTGFTHAGAIVKVTFNKGADAKDSKMGVIFGLEEKDGKSNFNIIGVAPNGQYYVSTYKNVEDIQDENFGVYTGQTTQATEKEWVKLSPSNKVTLKEDSNGNKYIYVMYRAMIDGTYQWAIGDLKDDDVAAFDSKTGTFGTKETQILGDMEDFGIITNAFTVEGGKVIVQIGSVPHPMLPEHYIEWVSLQTKFGNQRKALHPGDEPVVCFSICEGDEVEAVYAYCNLHSLWKA